MGIIRTIKTTAKVIQVSTKVVAGTAQVIGQTLDGVLDITAQVIDERQGTDTDQERPTKLGQSYKELKPVRDHIRDRWNQ